MIKIKDINKLRDVLNIIDGHKTNSATQIVNVASERWKKFVITENDNSDKFYFLKATDNKQHVIETFKHKNISLPILLREEIKPSTLRSQLLNSSKNINYDSFFLHIVSYNP